MNRTFLLLNLDGDLLGLAMRLQEEGYQTHSWYSPESDGCSFKTGDGIVTVVDDYFDILNQFKDKKDKLIVVIDDNSMGDLCDYLRSEGWKVIGSSHFADEAEHNRGYGNKMAEEIGLTIPPSKAFTDFVSARTYLQRIQAKHPEAKFVFKGDGRDLAGGAKTYVSTNVEDMLRYLDWIEKDQVIHRYQVERFKIQLVINGLEVDYSSYFNGSKFTPVMGLTFEQKRIHGLGKAEGCLGQIFCFRDPRQEPYFKKHIAKLSSTLEGTTPAEWAINNIVGESDHLPYFLEFTPRFGWDCFVGEMTLLKEAGQSIGDFLIRLAEQKPFAKDYFPLNRYAASVRLYSEGIGSEGGEIKGKPIYWDESVNENFWAYHIRRRETGQCELTGNPIGVFTATGDTVEEAVSKVYSMILPSSNLITTPDIFYSETIGEGVKEDIERLTEWGWLAPLDDAKDQNTI